MYDIASIKICRWTLSEKREMGKMPEVEIVPNAAAMQLPRMQIEQARFAILYEQAFLCGENICTTEYALNTTTWD